MEHFLWYGFKWKCSSTISTAGSTASNDFVAVFYDLKQMALT